MGAGDQAGARVGHRRAARVRHQAEIGAVEGGGEQGVERGLVAGAAVGRQLADVGVAQRVRIVELLEVGARRTRGLDDEMPQAGGDRLRLGRQEAGPGGLAEPDGDQVEGAERGGWAVCAHQGSSTPSARSMRDSAISGRPMSAVGSSPDSASSRLMPRPSTFALPAQSSGRSFAT